MPEILFRDFDPDDFRRQIVADLAAEIQRISEAQSGPRFVDRNEMAGLIGVSLATLDNLVAGDLIPSNLIGRRRLFNPEKVILALEDISHGS